MKTLFKKINSDYRHYICICITLFFILFGVLYFHNALGRLWESLKDVFTSSWFYIAEMFEFEFTGTVTINEYTKMPFKPLFNLPKTSQGWATLWEYYWEYFFSMDNYNKFNMTMGKYVYYFSKLVLLILPLFVCIDIMLSTPGETCNDYNKDSKALIFYKKYIQQKFIIPIKNWILGFIEFVKNHKIYFNICLFMILYSFNFITILIEAFSFYVYFVASFKFSSIFTQIIKLITDLSVVVNFKPTSIWTIIRPTNPGCRPMCRS